MGLYDQGPFDIKSAVDYLLAHEYGNYFYLEDFQEIRLEDFRSTFLGSESKRLVQVITKGYYRELFNAANRLGILQECLDTQVSFSSQRYEFTGTLSGYLQYRIGQNDDYSKKYTDILAEIQEMQNARSGVVDQKEQQHQASSLQSEKANFDNSSFFGNPSFQDFTIPTYSARNSSGNRRDDDDKQSTFWSRNKGKIAFGVAGTLLLVGGIAAACILGQPLIKIVASVGAAMMLMSMLAITTDRGYKEWENAKNWLNDLCISKPEPKKTNGVVCS